MSQPEAIRDFASCGRCRHALDLDVCKAAFAYRPIFDLNDRSHLLWRLKPRLLCYHPDPIKRTCVSENTFA